MFNISLLPKRLIYHILLEYLTFGELQTVILATHFNLPVDLIEKREYLIEKRSFTEKGANEFILYRNGVKLNSEGFSCLKFTQNIVFSNIDEIEFAGEYFDFIDMRINTNYDVDLREDIQMLNFLIENKLTSLLQLEEPYIIEEINRSEMPVCEIIVKILVVRNFIETIIYFKQAITEKKINLIEIAVLAGKMDICEWAFQNGFNYVPEYIFIFMPVDKMLAFVRLLWKYKYKFLRNLHLR